MKHPWKSDPRRWGVVTSDTGSPVADVWRRDAIGVIIAAPVLLNACKAAVEVCPACTSSSETRCSVCQLLLSAIAVAESEP